MPLHDDEVGITQDFDDALNQFDASVRMLFPRLRNVRWSVDASKNFRAVPVENRLHVLSCTVDGKVEHALRRGVPRAVRVNDAILQVAVLHGHELVIGQPVLPAYLGARDDEGILAGPDAEAEVALGEISVGRGEVPLVKLGTPGLQFLGRASAGAAAERNSVLNFTPPCISPAGFSMGC